MNQAKRPEEADSVRKVVAEGYARIAESSGSCCGPAPSCCGTRPELEQSAQRLGYSIDQIEALPEGANLGFSLSSGVVLPPPDRVSGGWRAPSGSLKLAAHELAAARNGPRDCMGPAQRR